MRVRGSLLTASLVVCLAAFAAAQQTAPPIFRSGVDAVELDVIAINANGDPVTDLTAADFEVREEGKPQTITSFTRVDIPIEKVERPLFAGRDVEPDVLTNEGPDGRVYVIAFENVDPADSLKTRRFLRGFIEEHFGTNDVGAVVYLGPANRNDAQELTSNRRLLLAAIDKFAPWASGAAVPPVTPTEVPEAGTQTAAAGGPSADEMAGRFDQRQAMRSFRDLVEFMATLRGRRKSLLYVSAGWRFDVFDVVDYRGGVLGLAAEDAHAALRAATRGNVTIYTIDPRGVSVDGLGDGGTETAPEVDRGAALHARSNLRALAEVTGGFGFLGRNDFDRAFERIVRENSSYYLLGYTPTDERRDGRFRKLEVRVKRPGVQVRARSGYVAPRTVERPRQIVDDAARLSAPVRESLGSPVHTRGVPLRFFAAPFKGADGQAAVALAVETTMGDLDLAAAGNMLTGEIEVGFTAVSSQNKVFPGKFHVAKVTAQGGPGRVVRVLEEAQLRPGRYQVRAAFGNRLGKSGSVVYDLEVPDFTKAPLVMSGVALTSGLAGQALTIRPNDPLRDRLPGPATAAREFSTADTVAIYAEVYDNLRSAAGHTVRIAAELQPEGGQPVRTVADERSSKELASARGGYAFTAEFPLLDVAPGRYVIHVEARAETGDRPVVTRDVLITVR